MSKKFKILGTVGIIFMVFISGVVSVIKFREINKRSISSKYNEECFAGCRPENKCPIVQPYYRYSPDDIKIIMNKYNLTQEKFDRIRERCY